MEDHLTCGVCFEPFNTTTRRPFDIGCHTFCGACVQSSPRSFRYCPECRARASNPHVNIALLRLLEAMPGGSGGGGRQGPAAAAGARHRAQQSGMPAGNSGAGAGRGGGSGLPSPLADMLNSGHHPQGRLGSWLNKLPANMPLGGATATAGQAAGAGAGASSSASSVAAHQAKIATWRSRMWVWLAPLLGFMYLLSPFDLIPDILPLIGWVDDALVVVYLACSVWRTLQRNGRQ